MTEHVLSVQEKAALFCTKSTLYKPDFIVELESLENIQIEYKRRNSWSVEELFVSSILLLFVIMLSSVAFLVLYSRFENVFLGILAFVLVFIPLFYLDFIWLFSSVHIQVDKNEILKTHQYGIFKRQHRVSISEINAFKDDEMQLLDGSWRLASERTTNMYLIYRIAVFLAEVKNTK